MPQYVEVNGNVIEFPDGMSAADMEAAVNANVNSIKPAQAVRAGKAINDIPRQVGLAARYGLEGLANTAQIATEPIRNALLNLRNSVPMLGDSGTQSQLMMSRGAAPAMRPLGEAASSMATAAGLPSPEGANERVIGDAARLVAGAGGLGAAARSASALPGALGQAGSFLAANMPQQLGSAAGAGLLGGASREGGGSPLMQAGAALLGGVGGGMATNAVNSVARGAKNFVSRPDSAALDQQISVLLQRADVDYSQFPAGVRNALREDVASAMRTGKELDPQAVARLAAFRLTGTTPTRGMVSQDPTQITREMNLSKIGANSSDQGLHGLPLLQNRNNSQLIQNLNQGGAAQGDPFRAGQAAIGGIQSRDATLNADVNRLYGNVRNMAGGDIPLDRKPFIDNVFGALARENRMAFLPKEIGETLNQISSGQTPFTPQTVDMLKTMMATASRSAGDGNVRAALSIARNALEATPVNLPPLGGGMATGAQASMLRGATGQANDVLNAMNEARRASAQRFAWQESARPVEAALGGAQPDKFVQQFVIRGTVDDAQAIAQNAPVGEVKNAIMAHLKEKALNGASDEVGKFSQSAFNKALNEIGERKLSLFFTPEEITLLRANARASSLMQVQPVGSAVNNSNSGALLLGKGYDALMNLGEKVPFLGPMIVPPVKNIEISMRNRQAQNVLPGLLARQPRQPAGQALLLPGFAVGGLLASPQ